MERGVNRPEGARSRQKAEVHSSNASRERLPGVRMGIARSLLGVCFGWLLLLTALPARAADTVVLTDATPAVSLSPHVLYYHDVAAKDSLRDSAHAASSLV